MKLPSTIVFTDEKTQKAFLELKKEEPDLHKQLVRAFEDIEQNAFCGIQIPKKLIPKGYNVHNLWKYNLPGAWRLLYSVENKQIAIVSIILEWMSHKDYERRFNY